MCMYVCVCDAALCVCVIFELLCVYFKDSVCVCMCVCVMQHYVFVLFLSSYVYILIGLVKCDVLTLVKYSTIKIIIIKKE